MLQSFIWCSNVDYRCQHTSSPYVIYNVHKSYLFYGVYIDISRERAVTPCQFLWQVLLYVHRQVYDLISETFWNRAFVIAEILTYLSCAGIHCVCCEEQIEIRIPGPCWRSNQGFKTIRCTGAFSCFKFDQKHLFMKFDNVKLRSSVILLCCNTSHFLELTRSCLTRRHMDLVDYRHNKGTRGGLYGRHNSRLHIGWCQQWCFAS